MTAEENNNKRGLKNALLGWARNVFADAGLSPTQAQVVEIAGTIGHLLMSERLVPFAKSRGIEELFGGWLEAMKVRRENVLEHLDGARSILIVMLAEEVEARDGPERVAVETRIARDIDALITKELADSRDEFVTGVTEEFGAEAALRAHTTQGVNVAATSGSGCLLAATVAMTISGITVFRLRD